MRHLDVGCGNLDPYDCPREHVVVARPLAHGAHVVIHAIAAFAGFVRLFAATRQLCAGWPNTARLSQLSA
jgi:hypothetical protein